MRPIATHVRRAGFCLALLAPISTIDGQVAIQVKSGTTWTSNIELSTLAPITFRWRWDGAEIPTGVAWQLATVTPTSISTTRGTDIIASETGMRLPAKAGVYEEFTVTPASSWPGKFYIRVRVNIDRKAVYSRWATITVAREAVAPNPTCTVEGVKARTFSLLFIGNQAVITQPIKQDEHFFTEEFPSFGVRIVFKNRLNTNAWYRRDLTVYLSDKVYTPAIQEFVGNPQQGYMLSPGKADTIRIPLSPSPPGYRFERHGRWRFVVMADRLGSGTNGRCELRFNTDYIPR